MAAAAVDVATPSPAPDPLNTSQTIGKRKRSTEPGKPATSDGIAENGEISEIDRNKFNSMLEDLLEVLKDCDSEPSVLDFSIQSIEDGEHTAKRTKLGSTPPNTTIKSSIASHNYVSIDDLASDISKAVDSLTESSSSEVTSERIRKFEEIFKELMVKEIMQNPSNVLRVSTTNPPSIKEEDNKIDKKLVPWSQPKQNGQTVLTLHGGLSGGKQLFSSLKHVPSDSMDPLLFTSLSEIRTIRDTALPNGISTTTIIPIQNLDNKDKDKDKEPPTIGELCPVSSHVPSLNPPKPSSVTTTRDPIVGWYKPDGLAAPVKRPGGARESYNYQHLSGGQWLSYNVPPTALPQSTGEKRKQRDRALSTGETNPERSEEDLEKERQNQEAHQQIRDNELFKSVYTSFSPSHDDSAAVVPQQIRSKLWWHKIRQLKHQEDILPEDAAAFEQEDIGVYAGGENEDQDEDQAFKAAVDAFDESQSKIPPELDINSSTFKKNHKLPDATEEVDDKDVDEILAGISELLETLNSYQRVRHMSLATTTQTSAGQNKPLAELSGSPTNPSEAEFSVYNMLKDQLTIMVSMLPPYALAKLNGDQLEDLNISRKILIAAPRHKGIIPDDSNKQAHAPVNGVANQAIRPQTVQGIRPGGYPPQTTTPHRNSYAAARPGASSYYSQTRPTSSSTYTPYTPQTAPQVRPYQQYPGQTTPGQMHQYVNGGRPLAQNGYSSHNLASATPIPPRSSQHSQRPNAPGYSSRPSNTPGYVSGYPIAGGRHGSPTQNLTNYTAQRPPQTPVGQTFSQHGQGSPQRLPNNYANHLSNGMTGAQAAGITPEQQQRIINEQKAQITQQQAAQRTGSGTPQPVNGQSPLRPQSNGTPAAAGASPGPQTNGENGV